MTKTADDKFWKLRNSGYDGPIDQDGNAVPPDDPRAKVLAALRERGASH